MPQPENIAVAHDRVGDAARPLGRGDAAHQTLRGVRRHDAARPLVAVEGQGVGAQVVAPEALLERVAQPLGLAAQRARTLVVAKRGRELGGVHLGRIHVALHLAERHRPFGQRAVGMEDRVVRVLPALVRQAAIGGARVLDEAVAVGIAVTIDPGQRRLDVRPEPARSSRCRRCADSSGRRAARRAASRPRCRSRP